MVGHLFWNPCKKCSKVICIATAKLSFSEKAAAVFSGINTQTIFKTWPLIPSSQYFYWLQGSLRNTQWAVIPQPWAIQAAFQPPQVKQPPHSCAILYTWKTISKIVMVLLGNLDMQSLLNCHKVPYYQFCYYRTASRHTVSLCCISFHAVRKQEHMNDCKNEAKCTVEKLGILLFLGEL